MNDKVGKTLKVVWYETKSYETIVFADNAEQALSHISNTVVNATSVQSQYDVEEIKPIQLPYEE